MSEPVFVPGLPVHGVDAAGADAYATVVTSPRAERYHCLISVETKAAIVSFDNGVTDHLTLQPGTYQLNGLKIPAGSVIKGKNATAGQNYANLAISVW